MSLSISVALGDCKNHIKLNISVLAEANPTGDLPGKQKAFIAAVYYFDSQ